VELVTATTTTTGRAVAAACDGARKGDGCGGWGVAVCLADGRLLERSGAERDTTNNRQELRAAIEALQLLAQLPHAQGLELATDSRYVLYGLTRWLPGWKRNGWRTAQGAPVLNQDLWEQLGQAAAAAPGVRLIWVRGHNGHTLNEAADRLASAAAEALQQQQTEPTTTPEPPAAKPEPNTPPPPGLLPHHWAELEASGIAPDVAALNFASFGPGTSRHWETERGELTHYGRRKIQTESTTASGLPQAQPGHLAARLIALDSRYKHLAAGGWRTLSAELEGLPTFDQLKPDQPRQRGKRNKAGQWVPEVDAEGRPVPQKYESPPAFPDGGGAFLPRVPERCWRLICDRQGLAMPTDPATLAAGFWEWAIRTPKLEIIAAEGGKKAAALVSAGFAAISLPGVSMGIRGSAETGRRLIAALRALSARHHRKRCRGQTLHRCQGGGPCRRPRCHPAGRWRPGGGGPPAPAARRLENRR
jgi:ribonuclease HI